MLIRTVWWSFALVAAFALAPAVAQVLYKSTMPDGRVVYGDKPVEGAAKVEPYQPDTAKTGVQMTTPREKGVVQQMEQERLQREQAQDALLAAEKRLREAEAAVEAGREPLPGERLGTVGGGSRLTDEYWARQKALESAVEQARRNLDEARARR
jgi:hypothetical protein